MSSNQTNLFQCNRKKDSRYFAERAIFEHVEHIKLNNLIKLFNIKTISGASTANWEAGNLFAIVRPFFLAWDNQKTFFLTLV